MATATGVVQGVYSKDVTTRFGNKKVWDIKLDDGQYYKNGFKKPIADVGDSVSIEYTVDKYGNEITSLIRSNTSSGAAPSLNDGGSTKPTPSPNQYSSNRGNKPFPVPSDHGDRSIIRQNSLTNARELVVAQCLKVGTIPSSSMPLDSLVDLIIATAYKFEEYSSGDREVKAVDSLMEANATSKVKKPKLKVVKAEVEDTDGE